MAWNSMPIRSVTMMFFLSTFQKSAPAQDSLSPAVGANLGKQNSVTGGSAKVLHRLSGRGLPVVPFYCVAGLTTPLRPYLTNDFYYSYRQNFWLWNSAFAPPQTFSALPALPAPPPIIALCSGPTLALGSPNHLE